MNMHEEYAQNVYREEEMPEYFGDVIEHVIKKIDHGHICDLGAHAIGHYWAMGYIERVESYSCYDLSSEAIDIFKKLMENWQPGDLMKKHSVYMNYLYEQGVITAPPEEIERQLVNKLDTVKVFDFLKDTPDKTYDIVLANESLPVVDTYEQFVTAMRTAYNFLKDGGLLLTVSGPFEKVNENIKNMQDYKIEGSLNPTSETFENAMLEVGFKDIQTKTITVHNFDNYKRLDICSARR